MAEVGVLPERDDRHVVGIPRDDRGRAAAGRLGVGRGVHAGEQLG